MKKNLRLLCLGLAAATFTCGFAQEDKTSLLQNADMELGLKGWGFDGEQIMGKNTKAPAAKTGFYGMNQGVLEAWNGNLSGLAEGYVMQRLSGLPNGTYVFGAYAAASKQTHRTSRRVEVAPGDTVTKYEYWSNRDSVYGVKIFANEATVPVATNNPDWHGVSCMKNGIYNEGHAMKFNVAVTLTDTAKKKGYLDVGIRYDNTNANYVVWDNVTLYYFDDMNEADALDAMAKIDVEAAIAIADTLKKEHMNADTLEVLTKVLDDAGKAEITAADLWNELDEIFLIAGKARKSAADYAALEKNLESALLVADGVWRDDWKAFGFADCLAQVITEAENAYNAKAMNRAELTELRKELNWAAGDLKMDSLIVAQNALRSFISEAKKVSGQPDGYTAVQISALEELDTEIAEAYSEWENDVLDPATGEIKAAKDRTVNPNDYYSYIARIYTAIENVVNNPISAEYTKMPIEFKAGEDGWVDGAEMYSQEKGIVAYTSPLYRFQGKIENFRVTVGKNKAGNKFFCLSGMEFFDGDGNKIPLTEENLSSNADHNTLNPGAEDGGGIPALFDDDDDSFFHSAWQNMPSADHYLEVTLPNGGYDAFSFRMLGRANNGWDQSHTFPGEMIISTPMPERDELIELVNAAKEMNAYSVPEPGFYTKDFSYLLEAIAEIEAALVSYPSEDECKAMADEFKQVKLKFEKELNEDASIYLPEEGKQYRIISGFPGYYEKQFVEKALTVNKADSTLWWENVCADSLQQVFEFEPIMQDGEHVIITEDGVDYYCYTMKNVDMGLYVDSAFVGDPASLHLVEAATDTVKLKCLGRGQWNILVQGSVLHCGDHNSGNPSESAGAYGGVYGISSRIVPYGGGIDGASAWFIREMPALPLKVEVTGTEFKSICYHFQAANTITLTADKDCAFADLALYDLYGNAMEVDTVVVKGTTATITTPNNVVGCAFAFTNNEGVAEVQFDAFEYTAAIELLQAAYDEAVAVAPEQGTEVGMYADITAYTEAIEAAEAMLEAGAPSDEEIDEMIERLQSSIEGLTVNMPEAGKYYFIYNAVEAFETNKGYKMAMYLNSSALSWKHENHLDWSRYWQFEPATKDELKAAGMDSTACAYFIKNVAEETYIANGEISAQIAMTSSKSSALPYMVTVLGSGYEVALDGLGQAGKRLHAAGHGGGSGNGGTVVYWNAAAGTASAWHIVETQFDLTDIDFTEVETEKAVVKGTYDLFGRRVVAPTAPGIYIIDGRKKLVK